MEGTNIASSSAAPAHFDLDSPEKTKRCVNILRNFYNYIMHHNVCTEYMGEILAARKVCDLAEKELVLCYKVTHASGSQCLPGEFNLASSCLFGSKGFNDDLNWAGSNPSSGYSVLSKNVATKLFAMGYAACAGVTVPDHQGVGEDRSQRIKQQTIVDIEEDIGLEVVGIEFPDSRIKMAYERFHDSPEGMSHDFKPVGVLKCKSWTPPDFAAVDLPAEALAGLEEYQSYEFWIEDEILRNCFIGMKIEGTVYTMSSGVQFLDSVTAVRCSFYTVLENELMSRWKEPKYFTREEYLERQAKGQDDEDSGPGLNEID